MATVFCIKQINYEFGVGGGLFIDWIENTTFRRRCIFCYHYLSEELSGLAKAQRKEIRYEMVLDKGRVSNEKHSADPAYCWQLLTLLLHYSSRGGILLLENH